MFCERCGHENEENVIFCEGCCSDQLEKRNEGQHGENQNERDIITQYFNDGYSYKTILNFLSQHHGIHYSLRTLKRKLRHLGLSKEANITNMALRAVIGREITGPSANLGYRSMWGLLKTKYNIKVSRDVVMQILKELNPDGAEERRQRSLRRRTYRSLGANAVWHVDGYDKLKPYGLAIHGGIDGFSRKILWLKVCKSNNNPIIPAKFYVETIIEHEICPRVLRTDHGTENGLMAGIHCTIYQDATAHKYGSSVTNQRIENWWSSLRKRYTGWLIDLFKRKIANGTFVTGSNIYLEVSWFAFSTLVQTELSLILKQWNIHYIRKSPQCTVYGIPNELYHLPQSFGYSNYGRLVNDEELNNTGLDFHALELEAESLNKNDPLLLEYFMYVINLKEFHWPPLNWKEAEDIFDTVIALCI